MTFQQTLKRQPSKKAKQRVRNAFDSEALAYLCETWDLDDYAERVDLPGSQLGRERFYYYKNNGSDILAIAHLDSVQEDTACQVTSTAAGLLATSGGLDDRLGVYVILDMLPKLGITCDWLLTTDEEIGQSTAEDFKSPDKAYNWMFQFDRGGTDVVMYDYETPDLRKLVEDCGARVGMGSFSDICMLEDLGCAGFNWGVGYEEYHGPRSHAWLEDTFRMVARFVKFYNANKDKVFFYEPKPYVSYGSSLVTQTEDIIFDSILVVDCGHAVNVDDRDTYIEQMGGSILVCRSCGTMPEIEESA